MNGATYGKERPILFSGSMVRAILDGRKMQTRRVAKPKRGWPIDFVGGGPKGGPDWNDPSCWGFEDHNTATWWLLKSDGDGSQQIPCPYGQPGDRLWVRETWAQPAALDPGPTVYRADYPACVPAGFENIPPVDEITWKPSIHMPRTACRLRLEITGVRVEKLNDCSMADAIAEGAPPSHPSIDVISREFGYEDFPRSWYAQLWDAINGAGAWAANPWVWVIEFRRIV